jgi:hypothetical protein
MVDTPLDKLLEIGYGRSEQEQGAFNDALAKELEPDKTPHAVLEELGQNHPAPDQCCKLSHTFTG